MTNRKITKKEIYQIIREFAATANPDVFGNDILADDVVDFCDNEIEILDHRAEKAKENQAKKKAESDALKQTLAGMLTNDFMIIADFVARLDDEEITSQRVSTRLSALAAEGIAEKQEVVVEMASGTRARRIAYRLATKTDTLN